VPNKIKREKSMKKWLRYCNLRRKRRSSLLLPVKGIKRGRLMRFLMKNQIVPSFKQTPEGVRF